MNLLFIFFLWYNIPQILLYLMKYTNIYLSGYAWSIRLLSKEGLGYIHLKINCLWIPFPVLFNWLIMVTTN